MIDTIFDYTSVALWIFSLGIWLITFKEVILWYIAANGDLPIARTVTLLSIFSFIQYLILTPFIAIAIHGESIIHTTFIIIFSLIYSFEAFVTLKLGTNFLAFKKVHIKKRDDK